MDLEERAKANIYLEIVEVVKTINRILRPWITVSDCVARGIMIEAKERAKVKEVEDEE